MVLDEPGKPDTTAKTMKWFSAAVAFITLVVTYPYCLYILEPGISVNWVLFYSVFCWILPSGLVLFPIDRKIGWLLLIIFYSVDSAFGLVMAIYYLSTPVLDSSPEYETAAMIFKIVGHLLEAGFVWVLFSPYIRNQMR